MNSLIRRPSPLTADLLLLLVTALWGSTFVIVKDALGVLPPNEFIALRFGVAALCLAIMGGWRSWLQPAVLKAGVLTGLFLAGGYIFQTVGLVFTSPAKAGFLTGLSVVLVPVFLAVTNRRKPSLPVTIGVVTAVIGLGLLSLGPGLTPNIGDLLVLLCAICFALQIIMVSRFADKVEARALAGVQLATVACLSGGLSLFERHPASLSLTTLGAVFFTAILATAFAFLVQSRMQRFTTASHTALIFAAEPVFAALFSYLWLGERLGSRGLGGATLIIAGIVVAEAWPLSLIRQPEISNS